MSSRLVSVQKYRGYLLKGGESCRHRGTTSSAAVTPRFGLADNWSREKRLMHVRPCNAVTGPGMSLLQSGAIDAVKNSVEGAAVWVTKLVHDGFRLVLQLIRLVIRVQRAAETIMRYSALSTNRNNSGENSSSRTLALVQVGETQTEVRNSRPNREEMEINEVKKSPEGATNLPKISVAAQEAVRVLQATLMDATGTLESKYEVLSSAAGDRLEGLYNVTKDTAEVFGSVELVKNVRSADAFAARRHAEKCAATVMQQEEALRAAIFSQVMSQLRENKNKKGF